MMNFFSGSIFTLVFIMLFSPIPDRKEVMKASQLQQPLFSFGILADVQYADAEAVGARFYRSSLSKLDVALKTFKKDSVDFVITLGDLIDGKRESYKPVLSIIKASGLKFFHITGNHDYNFEKGSPGKIPSSYYSKKGYYSLIHNNFKFIFLNGNEISVYGSSSKKMKDRAQQIIDSLKKTGSPNAMVWNGGISQKQIKWLDEQLKSSVAANEKVFIFCHFPVFPENVHNMQNYSDILTILKKYDNIIAWFNGHNHAGNYGNTNSVHYVTLKGMVETENQNSFARIDVYSNKIWIVGYGREKNQILAY